MPSHFSDIGIPYNSEEEMDNLIHIALKTSKKIQCKYGYYLIWSSHTGVQLWIQANKNNNLIGVTPFFDGESSFNAGITKLIKRKNDTKFECAIHAWANPPKENPTFGYYPFVFDLINYGEYDKHKLPYLAKIKLTAFGNEVSIYKDETAFHENQKPKPGFASKSFIPAGLFTPDGKKTIPPTSYAIFTGIILEHKLFINELTQQTFHWLLVNTYGGIIDVVIDPSCINETIEINGIISGSFYLIGKIIY